MRERLRAIGWTTLLFWVGAASCWNGVAMAGGPAGADSEVRPAETSTVVYVVRHAEKQKGDDPELTAEGRARAENLARLLQQEPLDAVLSTPFRRTMQTAEVVAQSKGLEITSTPIEGGVGDFVAELSERIRRDHRGQRVLVVGHSNTVPQTLDALGAQNVPRLTDQEYDDLFVVFMASDEAPTWLRLNTSRKN